MRLWLLVVAVAVALGGCSLFANYDPEGLPCDPGARRGEECIPDAGFQCVRDGGASGVCVRLR